MKRWYYIGEIPTGGDLDAALTQLGYAITKDFTEADGLLLLPHWENNSNAIRTASWALAHGLEIKSVCPVTVAKTGALLSVQVWHTDSQAIRDTIKSKEAA